MDWYQQAYLRRDGNWAPSSLQHAAEDELIAETAERGGVLHREEAARMLMKEMWDRHEDYKGAQMGIANEVLRTSGWKATRKAPGRPRWTPETFRAAYREAMSRAGQGATIKEIAVHMGRSAGTLKNLLRRFPQH
jgi:hypothetical protein